MTRTINTVQDLRQEVSDQLMNYDLAQYCLVWDDLISNITEDLYELLKATGFNLGDTMPEVSQETFDQIIKPYEESEGDATDS